MGEGTRYLVLCDLLHDILGINHPSEMRAMVRIEDVSVDDDPDDLTRIANWLSDRHIPFGIALIPIFRDPAHSLEIRLGDRKSTVEGHPHHDCPGWYAHHAWNYPPGARIERG